MQSTNLATLYIVRHGTAKGNEDGILMGQYDSPLTEQGELEAKTLAQETLKNITFDALFSSDLLRAKRTAEIIALEHNLIVQTKEALRERYWAGLQELPRPQIKPQVDALREELQKLSYEELKKYKAPFPDKNGNSAESTEELTLRLIQLLREIAVAYPGKNILVVSHSGVMSTLLVHMGYVKQEGLFPPDIIKNGGYIKLRSDGVEMLIDELHGVDLPK